MWEDIFWYGFPFKKGYIASFESEKGSIACFESKIESLSMIERAPKNLKKCVFGGEGVIRPAGRMGIA